MTSDVLPKSYSESVAVTKGHMTPGKQHFCWKITKKSLNRLQIDILINVAQFQIYCNKLQRE